jgi:hypothetical protein
MGRMQRLDETLERREDLRARRRLACTLLMGGRRHEGIVRDVSASSLYVQTAAELRCGVELVVSLKVPDGELFVLEACVRETRIVARSLAAVSAGGAVLRLEDPPAAWLRFVEAECRN